MVAMGLGMDPRMNQKAARVALLRVVVGFGREGSVLSRISTESGPAQGGIGGIETEVRTEDNRPSSQAVGGQLAFYF